VASWPRNIRFSNPTLPRRPKTEDTTTDDVTKVRVYTLDGYTGGKLVCMYFHGGGWAIGDVNGDDLFSGAISKAGGIVVVSVEYRLALDNKHPGLMDECYKALLWALGNSKRLNTVEGKFVTAGLSAGGQLAFAAALRGLDEGSGEFVGIVALIPVTVHPDGLLEILRPGYTAMEEHD
jgi:versiconal hemiacetal acetate esterase